MPARERDAHRGRHDVCNRHRHEGELRVSKTTLVAAGGLVGVALYLAGYLPERSRRVQADAMMTALRADVDAKESRIRVGVLLGQALMLEDLATQSDYGQAQAQSSRFFDAVRDEAQRNQDTELRGALMTVLGLRDGVTAALAKSDPGVVAALTVVERRLRAALGYPVAAERAPASPTS